MGRPASTLLVALAGIASLLSGCVALRSPAPAGVAAPSQEATRFRARMIHDGAIPELADWETWITFYYTDPQPRRTVGAMRFFAERGDLERNPQPIAVFFGRVFAQNPKSVSLWVDDLRALPEDAHFVTALALWFSHVPDRDMLLDRLGEGGSTRVTRYVALVKSDVAPDLTTIEVRQPVELDMLWASFFATGDTRFLERIVHVIPPAMEPGSTVPLPAGARWSLTANAVAHSTVLEFCRRQASLQPERAATLNDIVARAEAERGRIASQPAGEPAARRR
ncbi:MAG TPA: hypothetical protein VGK30_11930 [Candidatus Binatia bacterium]|jgi:hypothetical protein